MSALVQNTAQNSADIYGSLSGNSGSAFRLNGLESNPSNENSIKDWELGFTLGSSITDDINNNIYQVSISKRFSDHYFYARYSPGLLKEFNFRSGTKLILQSDIEVEQELQTNLKYSDLFGLGYSFQLTDNLNAGLSLRYFAQEFSEEKPNLIFSDSLNSISILNETNRKNYWRADLGFDYFPIPQFGLNFSTINLINALESSDGETDRFEMPNDKEFNFGAKYLAESGFNIFVNYETNNSFTAGVNQSFNLFGGSFSVGTSILHDKFQNPFIAAITPALNFSYGFYSISLTGIKYFSDRTEAKPLSDFLDNRFNNIFNNKYSTDRIFLSVNIALSFIPEQKVKFIEVEIDREIFPALNDEYQTTPFASARVVNLTDKKVIVTPVSFIPKINEDKIYSPSVNIDGQDTATVFFFTLINDDSEHIEKREILQTEFYLSTSAGEFDDQIQKPILVNDLNSWDSRVVNLRYFVKNDFKYSLEFAKNILANYKLEIENADLRLKNFMKTKILFDEFVKKMLYVSDPRATVERVQYPKQTIELKGGDCDDLSVAFSSLLESIGIQTAFVDYKSKDVSHVNLIINTNLSPNEAQLITVNDRKYLVRQNTAGKEEVWIPLEMTSLTNFTEAWSVAADKFYTEAVDALGLSKGFVEIVDIY